VSVGVVAIGINAVGSCLAIGVNAVAPISLAAVNGLGVLCFAGVNGLGTTGSAGVNGGYSPFVGGVLAVVMGVVALTLRNRLTKTDADEPACVPLREARERDDSWLRATHVEARDGGLVLRVGGEDVAVEVEAQVDAAARAAIGRGAFVHVRNVTRPVDVDAGYRDAVATRALSIDALRPFPESEGWADPIRLHVLSLALGVLGAVAGMVYAALER
jgi:hypothetical protein